MYFCLKLLSASSWGCELKFRKQCYHTQSYTVSLFVRLWVEIKRFLIFSPTVGCQPLREAVSWNKRTIPDIRGAFRQPLREAVSWNIIMKNHFVSVDSQPLREAVSWNQHMLRKRKTLYLSASSWGCELKCKYLDDNDAESGVSLFVRLWVEIQIRHPEHSHRSSASSWGCELKYTLCPRIGWKCDVSLFVRLWVEILIYGIKISPKASASSWGCELKYSESCKRVCNNSQPLREAVSWNNFDSSGWFVVSSSASSWGCELKYAAWPWSSYLRGQPLREAVSWNALYLPMLSRFLPSASSWGCELKYINLARL